MYVPKIDFEKWMNRKRCFVKIKNRDNLCCARALAVALAHNKKGDSQEAARYYRQICRSEKPQKEGALYLHQISGVPTEGSCGIDELKKFQAALPDYQIVVYSKDTLNEILYAGLPMSEQLFLYHYDDHFAIITSKPSFLGKEWVLRNLFESV